MTKTVEVTEGDIKLSTIAKALHTDVVQLYEVDVYTRGARVDVARVAGDTAEVVLVPKLPFWDGGDGALPESMPTVICFPVPVNPDAADTDNWVVLTQGPVRHNLYVTVINDNAEGQVREYVWGAEQ